MKRLISILLISSLLVSCNPISTMKELLFKEDKKEEVKSPVKEEKKSKPAKEKKAPKEKPETPEMPKRREVPPPKEPADQLPSPPPDLKSDSLPLTSVDHFGGEPTSIHLDEQYFYVGFGRKLIFYDHFLNASGFIDLEVPIVQLVSRKSEEEILLFVKEEGNILEIVSLPRGKKPEIVKSFQVDGPFDFSSSSHQLFVYLSDTVQVLSLDKPDDVSVVFDLPASSVRQAYSLGDYLYLAQNSNLNVISKESLSVLSSIPLETNFKILGSQTENGTDQLILGLQSPKSKKINAIQFMSLASGGGGVADFGHGIELSREVDEVIFNKDQPYLYLLVGGDLGLFGLKERLELKGAKAPIKSIRFVYGSGDAVFAASNSFIGRIEHQIISPPEKPPQPPAKKEAKKDGGSPAAPDVAGLAFESEDTKKVPSYQWTQNKIVPVAGSADKLFLLGNNSVLVVNGLAKDQPEVPPLFYSESFSKDTSYLKPLWIPNKEPANFTLGTLTKYGVYLYDEKSGKIFLSPSDFSAVVPVDVAAQSVVGIDSGSDGNKDYLYLTVSKKDEQGENALYAYEIESAAILKKKGSLVLEQVGGLRVFDSGKKVIVACGIAGVCFIDSSDPSQMKLLETVPPGEENISALEVVLSPNKKVGYVFFNGPYQYVNLFNLTTPKPEPVSIIKNILMDREQFMGVTFSSGGRKLVLPNRKGLRVFDVSDPVKPVLLFDWPLGNVFSADVTNRGRTVCAALGLKGIECAEFTTPPKNSQVDEEL